MSAPPWHPSDTGALAFLGRASPELMTLSGANILALANDGGSAGPMTSSSGKECQYDTSVLQGGHGAIRTYFAASDLSVATGGPTGPFHLIVFAKQLSAGSSGGASSTIFTLGTPGLASASGIGSTPPGDGPVMWGGGYNNATIQTTAARFDTEPRVFELVNNGSEIALYRDFGWLAETVGATTLASGGMGWRGAYPLSSVYGTPDALTYMVAVFTRPLTALERGLFALWLKGDFAIAPRPYLVAIGDSRTAGHIDAAGTGLGGSNTSTIEQVALRYADALAPIDFLNAGISSQSTLQILNRTDDAFFDHFAKAGYRRQVLLVSGFQNDEGFGIDLVQSYANQIAVCDRAKARGIEAWICTTYAPVGSSAQRIVNINAYNDLVIANDGGATGVIDFRGLVPTPITTTQLPDNIHQSTALMIAESGVIFATVG